MPRTGSDENSVRGDLDRSEKLRLGSASEAGGEARCEPAAQHSVGIGAKRLCRERFAGSVRERERAGRLVVRVHEEGGVLDVEPAAEAAELDDEDPLRIRPAHARAERLAKPRMRDAHPVVPEAPVAAQLQPEGRELRPAAQSDSRSTLPSAAAAKTPRQS